MVEYSLIVLWTAFLLWRGSRRGGFASWAMFAELKMAHWRLEARCSPNEPWRALNVWDYLPHTYISMGFDEVQQFVEYLRDERGLEIRGTVALFEGMNRRVVTVGDGDGIESQC